MRLLLCLLAVLLCGCAAEPLRPGILYTAGDWAVPPAFHGNPWAPGGVGVARSFVYEPLFDYTPATEEYYPRLALSFQETADVLEVKLKRNVRWHDGEPFTSKDVRATFQIGYLGGLEIWHYLDRIECPDDFTVRFVWKLRSPTNALLVLTEPITTAEHLFREYLGATPGGEKATDPAGQVKQEQAAREVLYAERPALPVGTGPFRLRKVTASDLLLDRFPEYHEPLHVDGVRIARWGRNEVVWSYLYAGQLDAISPACPPDLAREILKRNPNIRLITPSDNNEMGLVLNTRRPELGSVQNREALAALLDRDKIRELACEVGDTSPPYSLGLVPSQAERWLGADFHPRAYRSEARWQGAAHLEILAPAGFTDLALLAEGAATQWTRAGIPTEVRLVQGELYAELLKNGDFDVAAVFGAQMGRTIHPSTSEGRFFALDGQLQVAAGYPSGRPAARKVEALRLETDPVRARQLTRELATLQNESRTFIPCFEKRLMIFVQDGDRLRGWPPADSPLWSAAPLGVENLYANLIVRGLVHR